jgi:hypothetical protein
MANVGGFLKKLAPFMATALQYGGPLGVMAGSAITAAIGAKPGAKIDDVLTSLSTTPMTTEQITAVKTAEEAFQLQMKTLDINSVEDLEKLANDDRASARNREIQVKDNTPAVLASVITLGFFFTLWYVFGHGVKPEAHDLAIGMVNVLGTAWVGVVSYYFGSSRGSDDKSKTIADIAKS